MTAISERCPQAVAQGAAQASRSSGAQRRKYFLTKPLENLRRDEKWYGGASDGIVEYWRYKNNRKGQDCLRRKGAIGKARLRPNSLMRKNDSINWRERTVRLLAPPVRALQWK